MLTNGTIANMSPLERQLYLVLALAADRRGISFHGDQRIQHTLGCTLDLKQARCTCFKTNTISGGFRKAPSLLEYDSSSFSPKRPPFGRLALKTNAAWKAALVLGLEGLGQARSDLMARDLLAYDGATYQLLTMPPDDTLTASTSRKPSQHSRAPRNKAAPAAAASSRLVESADEIHRHAILESIRVILRDIFGGESF